MDLNEINNIVKVSDKLDSAVCRGISKGKKHKKNKKYIKKAIIAVALVIAVLGTTMVVAPEVVRAIPGVENIYDLFGGTYGYKKYSNDMDITVDDKGLFFTLDKLSITDWKVVATFTITGELIKDNTRARITGGIKSDEDIAGLSKCRVKKVSDNTMVAIVEMNLMDSIKTDNFNIYFSLSDLSEGDKEVRGKWDIKLNVNKEDVIVATTEKKYSDAKITMGDKTYAIDELKMSPIGDSIKYTVKSDKLSGRELNTEYVIKDDKGNYILNEPQLGVPNEEGKFYNGTIDILSDLEGKKYIDIYPIESNNGDLYVENKSDGRMINNCINGEEEETVKLSKESEEKAWRYFNIDKKNSFYKLDELQGKNININKESSISIEKVDIQDNYIDLIVKYNGYVRKDMINIIDDNMKLYDYIALEDEWIDIDKQERRIRIDKLDLNKKYTIAVPKIKDFNIKEENKIRIQLYK